ncbi:MAG: hypothetical protein AB7O24_13560 [Kofleriaceae bacterium]
MEPAPSNPEPGMAWWFGHGMTGVAGVLALVASIAGAVHGIPKLLAVALAVLGGLFLVLTWKSLRERNRAAWAFLVSLSLMTAVSGLFGAPKLRNAAEIPLGAALLVPVLMTFTTIALASIRRHFRDR